MSDAPSKIIRQFLIDQDIIHDITASGEGVWKSFMAYFPELPDDAVCLYDTSGRFDGRMMRGGEKIEHPGLMVMVRGVSYERAWSKAKAIEAAFDSAHRVRVAIPDGVDYVVQNISRTAPLMSLGVETDGPKGRQRYLFTVNAVLTVRRATEAFLVGGEDFLLEPDGEPLFVESGQ